MAEGGFFEYLRQYLLNILPILACFVPAITLSSYVKARLAYHLNDPSAKIAGRMTLVPIHFDIIGTIATLMFYPGWASPIPVNLTNLEQKRQRIVWIELSGVATNLAIGLATLILYWIFKMLQPLLNLDLRFFTNILEIFGTFNVFYAILNLLPIPPLSGYRILVALFYHKPQGVLDSWVINLVGSIILMILFIWTPVLHWLIWATQLFTGIFGSFGQGYFSYFRLALFSRGF